MDNLRWICQRCGAPNMPVRDVCFRCYAVRPIAPPTDPTLLLDRQAYARRSGRSVKAVLLIAGVAALLLLLLNNPTREDFGAWAARMASERLRQDQPNNPFNALASQMGAGMVASQASVFNFGLGSVFETKGYDGKTAILAIGVCRQFIPLHLPDAMTDTHQDPTPLTAPSPPSPDAIKPAPTLPDGTTPRSPANPDGLALPPGVQNGPGNPSPDAFRRL